MQGCILPPYPQGYGQGGFFAQKKVDEGFKSNATLLFSKLKWKIWETDKSYLCLPQQVKRGCSISRTFFLANSWVLRKGSKQLISIKKIYWTFPNFQ